MVNLFPREVPRVLNLLPRELIEGPPKGFSEGKPEAASEARPKAKNPRGHRPQGFLALDLAEDAGEGLPEENPEGGLQSTPLGTNFELKVLPEGTDSPHYTQGFSTDYHSNKISTVNRIESKCLP